MGLRGSREGLHPPCPDLASLLLRVATVKSWMLDFYLRRLPTPEGIRDSWLFGFFGPSLMRMEYWLPSRHSLALGIGLGWFIGLLPVFGFRPALGLLAGALARCHARCHLPAVIFGTFISNPFTIPGILAFQYLAGRWLCHLAGRPSLQGFQETSMLAKYLLPLLTGGIATATVAGIIGYIGVRAYLGCRGKSIAGWVV
jgi:uncharacterized protein (DUF2062 family)